ncbi:hypothetical protein VB738_07775 [Cyanobium gracile UHCC 0139]|uniref:Uncharacterized protein n=1 Tax=Cyanobium gracile UHCC 0139 TaxID=3110308 RepID=A0ABU5RTT6_9CYAN|nr:hypothetical protein [Cyanobium gracile]MEA5391159.1 hypothetical protein [Cyanobium gracile UHCC 0139]
MQSPSLPFALAIALLPVAGWAAPFQFTPASFQQWLNANPGRWQEGRRVIFSNLSGCSPGQSYPESYACSQGFARISDPMGTRVCRVMGVTWRGIDLHEEKRLKEVYGSVSILMPQPGKTPKTSFRQGDCRWN